MNLRQRRILETLGTDHAVSVVALSHALGVSAMTVRRDLAALEAQGTVARTHGGAVLAARSVVEFSFRQRSGEHLPEKQAIARRAASLVEPGMTVVLDTGSTTVEVARALFGVPSLRVLTSSLAVASVLYAQPGLELVLLGGTVNARTPDLFGPLAEENLDRFRADLAVVGADALDAEGLYTHDLAVGRLTHAMLRSAERTCLAADSSKLRRRAFVRFARWDEVECMVTDSGLSPEDRRGLEETGVTLHLVTV